MALGSMLVFAGSSCVIAQLFPDDATAMHTLSFASGTGLLLGPLLGSALAYLFGLSAPFVIVGTFGILAVFLVLVLFPILDCRARDAVWRLLPQTPQTEHISGTAILPLLVACTAFAVLAMWRPTVGPFVTDELHQPYLVVGCMFALSNLVYAATAPLICDLEAVWSSKRALNGVDRCVAVQVAGLLLLAGSGFIAGPWPLLGLAPRAVYIWAAMVLSSLGAACTLAPAVRQVALLQQQWKEPWDAIGMAVNIGGIVGPVAAGLLTRDAGLRWSFAAAGAGALLVALLVLSSLCLSTAFSLRIMEDQRQDIHSSLPVPDMSRTAFASGTLERVLGCASTTTTLGGQLARNPTCKTPAPLVVPSARGMLDARLPQPFGAP